MLREVKAAGKIVIIHSVFAAFLHFLLLSSEIIFLLLYLQVLIFKTYLRHPHKSPETGRRI
jgi:hypothetical protein